MARPHVIYQAKPGSALEVDRDFYARLGEPGAKRTLIERCVIPRRTGRAWPVRAGQIFRIVAVEGPQVADLNVWSLTNSRERFWASRTRQLHQAHVSTFDRLWSCLPYLRPMLTITADTVQYGRDEDGAGCHDLLGTRCDPYVHKLLNGEEFDLCCHSNLVRAVAPFRLTELDVHDVLNVFQVTGLTAEGRYWVKPSPARGGAAAHAKAGQRITIVNTHGTQVVDAWAFNVRDLTEWMSMEASRAWFMKLAAAVGDSFVTNQRRPILTLIEDTSGCAHDTLMAPCDPHRYGLLGVTGYHDNCRDNLHAALAELGLAIPATPPSLNLFMNIPWTREGALAWGEPVSTPGSYARFRVED